MFLTQEEREKFASWLEQEAKDSEALGTQAILIKAEIVGNHLINRAKIFLIVAKDIRNIHTEEVLS